MAALGTDLQAAIAFTRFGLGARPDDAVPASAATWVLSQLNGPDPFQQPGAQTTSECLAVLLATRSTTNQLVADLFRSELDAILANALVTQVPFRERLVWFWANHFAVLSADLGVAACAGAFVREVIRPNVTGSFATMLLAAMQHPAMLISLNNTASAGPDSQAGLRCEAQGCADIGINENMGRECLELFTVGVAAQYTQADVDSLAMLLSGWTVNLKSAPYGFEFNPRRHEPGSQTLLGEVYGGDQAGALAALAWLGTHPLTYQHLATKLVTHFTSDAPDLADIATVTAALVSSGGNLGAAAAALVGLQNSWTPYTKFRTPLDYVVAAMRALGYTSGGSGPAFDPRVAIAAIGQNLWQPELPNGFADTAADWVGSAQVLLRSDWVHAFCNHSTVDAFAVAASALGPLVRPSTLALMQALAAPDDQLALLFLSPEFQRR